MGSALGGFSQFLAQFNDQCRTDGAQSLGGLSPQRPSLSGHGQSLSAPASSTGSSFGGSSTAPPVSSGPRQRLHLGSLPSMMTQPPSGPMVQTPMIENPNVNPLFESVRQAMGLSTNITEEIPVRLPMGFSVQTMQDHLPKWLLSAITEESGKSRLAEFFQVRVKRESVWVWKGQGRKNCSILCVQGVVVWAEEGVSLGASHWRHG